MSHTLLLLHYLSLAVLVLGYVQSISGGYASKVMVWGGRLQLLTGLALVMVAEMGHYADHLFISVKLLIMLVAMALIEISGARGRRGQVVPLLLHMAAFTVLVNVAVAYLLH